MEDRKIFLYIGLGILLLFFIWDFIKMIRKKEWWEVGHEMLFWIFMALIWFFPHGDGDEVSLLFIGVILLYLAFFMVSKEILYKIQEYYEQTTVQGLFNFLTLRMRYRFWHKLWYHKRWTFGIKGNRHSGTCWTNMKKAERELYPERDY